MNRAAVVFLSLLVPTATLGCWDNTCTNTNGSNAPISTGAGGAGGGSGVCECFTPPNVDLECRAIHPDETHMDCITEFSSDFAPCRSGVGVCIDQKCVPPIGAECRQKVFVGPWGPCKNDDDCDDGNPCTADSCPFPGCDTCSHAPRPDFMVCDPDGSAICIQGACCAGPLPS